MGKATAGPGKNREAGSVPPAGPSTWVETLLAMGAFLPLPILVALSPIMAALHEHPLVSDLALQVISVALAITIAAAFAVVLGLGWVKGFPRWSYPYWGLALALSGVIFDQWAWWGWLPVLLIAVVASLLARGVRPLRQLATGVWRDWTRLSFAVYGTLQLKLAIAFDEVAGKGPFAVALSAILVGGAVAYMHSAKIWQRVVALLAGFTLCWTGATLYLANYWHGRQEPWMPRPGDWSRTAEWMARQGITLLVLLLAPMLVGLLRLSVKPIRSLWATRTHRLTSRTLAGLLLLIAAVSVVLAGVVILNRPQSQIQRSDSVPPLYLDKAQDVVQVLSWGEVQHERPAPPDTISVTTGRRLYVIGDVNGGFRPRSNPYDLAAFGEPRADDPLGGELGGVWAQPVKALDGYVFVVEVDGQRWPLLDANRFTQTFADVQFDYQRGSLTATRRDFVPQERPALFVSLTLQNDGAKPVGARVVFYAYFDLEDAWLTSLADRRNTGETARVDGERIVATATSAAEAWAVAIGGENRPVEVRVADGPEGQRVGQFEYTARLSPGVSQSWTFAIVVETESGAEAALKNLDEWLPQREALLAEKRGLYETLLTAGPRFHSPDADLDAAFDIARANMQMLEAESLALGRFFYAGLEAFPYWFSNDLAYSGAGLTLAGFGPTVATHLHTGATQAAGYGGQVPHQLSPAGSLIAVGNVQETPQFVSAVWDYYRWTGDSAFLAEVYPVLVEGLFAYNLDRADQDGDGYPEGAAMVERAGMGPEKLDAACYLWSALNDLHQMAQVLGDTDTAARARVAADALQATFDADWWLPEEEVYANSLLRYKNRPRADGHWTVAVPLEVGIAPPAYGRASLERIQRDYLNEWGLVHTRGDDERVWTLPTATLSRGAYRYGDPEMGLAMLQHLAQTLDHGSIGMFHELIPEGLTSLQLWSGAMFVRGVVQDLMGITVRADSHAVTILPQLPAAWDSAELDNLRFGEHTIIVRATHTGITVVHSSGPVPLAITCRTPGGTETSTSLEPGETLAFGR